ncbi:MAG: hypothetical protein ABEJ99_03380 [Candidatus Nanohaloarchaea archaeon]
MELETAEDYRALLEQKGDVNDALEQVLPSQPDFSTSVQLPGDDYCNLCSIETDYSEKIPVRDPNFFIACTSGGPGDEKKGWEDGRKGHDVRYMAVWNNHGVIPSKSYMNFCGADMIDELVEVTAEEIEDGEMTVYGSMQSHEDHLHFVASDTEQDKGTENDLAGVNSYAFYSVESGEAELQEFVQRDRIGGYLAELIDVEEEVSVEPASLLEGEV